MTDRIDHRENEKISNPSHSNGISTKIGFKCIYKLLIPLLLGLFTIVHTCLQLSISKQQREQDLNIAESNRQKDFEIANYTREMDLFIASERYREEILVSFVKDISSLFLSSNFSHGDPIMLNILRAQTLSLFRQLDPKRKAIVLLFLFDSELIITGKNPIDLTDADLDNIDLSTQTSYFDIRRRNLKRICLSGASLINASFSGRDLSNANFSYATMTGVIFKQSKLFDTSFFMTMLQNANFDYSSGHNEDFTDANLFGANLQTKRLSSALSIHGANLPNGSYGQNPSLLTHGDGELDKCDNSLIPAWQIVANGTISLFLKSNNRTDLLVKWKNLGYCSFFVSGHGLLSMKQQVKVSDKYHPAIDMNRSEWRLNLQVGRLDGIMEKNEFILYLHEYDNKNILLQTFKYGK